MKSRLGRHGVAFLFMGVVWCVLPCSLSPQDIVPAATVREIPEDVPFIIRQRLERLQSSDAITRARAANVLGQMGARAAVAVPYLADLLQDDTEMSIFQTEGPLAGRALPTSVGLEAMRALVTIGEPAIEVLLGALVSEYEFVRSNAYATLSGSRAGTHGLDDRIAAEMINGLNDESHEVWRFALNWAGKYIAGSDGVVPPGEHRSQILATLLGLLPTEEWEKTEYSSDIARVIAEGDAYRRFVNVAEVLGEFGPEARAAIPALHMLLDFPQDLWKEEILDALAKIEGGA